LESFDAPVVNLQATKPPSASLANANTISSDRSSPMEELDSKPDATISKKDSFPNDAMDVPDKEVSLMDASRCLFNNQMPTTPAPMTVDDISPSVLNNLVYKASQYDSTHITTLGPSRQTSQDLLPDHINVKFRQLPLLLQF
jgi:hypothetical protein